MSKDGDIITNDAPKNNHGAVLKEMLSKSDRVVFASPYLTERFEDIFTKESSRRLRFVHLVTTCKQNDWDQVKKRKSLTSFIEVAEKRGFQYKISVDDALHGKVYIFQKSGTSFAGIVTSANLTTSGMGPQREYGSIVKDQRRLAALTDSLTSRFRIENFTKQDLEELGRKVDEYLATHGKPPSDAMDLNGTPNHPPDKIRGPVRYWIKPIGTSEDPLPTDHPEGMATNSHYFSRTPKKVQLGDILIIYTVGTKKLVTCYEVTSLGEYISDAEKKEKEKTRKIKWRWMWKVHGRNLAPEFGKEWYKRDMSLKKVAAEYQGRYGKIPLTHAGATNLRALEYGPDRLYLDPQFGEYLSKKIVEG